MSLGLAALNGKNSSEVFVKLFFGIFIEFNFWVSSYSMLEVGSVLRWSVMPLAIRNVLYFSFRILMLVSIFVIVDAMSLFRS